MDVGHRYDCQTPRVGPRPRTTPTHQSLGHSTMTYTGAATVTESRALLGSALAALQQEPNIPQDVLSVAENIAAAVGALFEAEQATSDVDGKSSVKHAMGSLSQTMALLQSVRSDHKGIDAATKRIAEVLSKLYPLTTIPSMRPPAPQVDGTEKTMMAQPRVEVKPAPRISFFRRQGYSNRRCFLLK